MKLIDKAAVVAEIERKIEAHKETLENCDSSISEMVLKGSMSAYQSFLHFLDTLDALDELGMDRHSPKYICPDDIYQMHDWLQRRWGERATALK